MSEGLKAVKPEANTPTTLYQVPEGKQAAITVSACNQGPGNDWISIQLSGDTPGPEGYIEYNAKVSASGVLERSGIILIEGEKITVTAQLGRTSFVVWGICETL